MIPVIISIHINQTPAYIHSPLHKWLSKCYSGSAERTMEIV